MRLFIGRTFAFGNRTFQTRPEGAFSSKVSERWEKALGRSNEMEKKTQTNKQTRKVKENMPQTRIIRSFLLP